MAIETANRTAESLLPAGLLDAETRESVLSNSMPSFLFAEAGSRILWSSHEAAKRFGHAHAGEFMRAGLPALAAGTQRIAVLGRGIAPDAPKRLERLRFNIGFRSLVLTALCEPIRLADGALALLVSFIEAKPARAMEAGPMDLEDAALQTISPPPDAVVGAPQDLVNSAPADAAPPTEPAAPAWIDQPSGARRTLRFVFALDANGIVERVTPPLADAVGAAQADIVGRPLAEIVDEFDEPAAEAIRGAVLGGQTWSGISVRWPVTGTDLAVPIDLSALPLVSNDEGLTGYSGFGRCHLDRAETRLAKLGAVLEAMPETAEPDASTDSAQAMPAAPEDGTGSEATADPDMLSGTGSLRCRR